jgi:cell wall-associated NlpC family hydrolase
MTNAGFSVSRLSAAAYSENTAWTKITSISSLQKGDLVFFHPGTTYISHMGIYIGDGQFVHASSGQAKVMVSSLSNSYWINCFSFARRLA